MCVCLYVCVKPDFKGYPVRSLSVKAYLYSNARRY